MEQNFGYWLPRNLSAHGAGIDRMINVLHVFMILLFVGWGIYLVYCLIRFRARPGHQAEIKLKHFKLPTYIEAGVVAFEIFLLVFLATPIWASYKNEIPAESESVVVRVVAEQFAWNAHYPGKDGKFGRTAIEKMDGTNPVGVDRDDPTGKDDIVTINNLHVVVNKPVIIHLTSKDVLHSLNLPVMRVKMDAVPGQVSVIHFTPIETGQFDIACAQLCGNSHYRMRGQLWVDTPEDFQKFIEEESKSLAGDAGGSNP